MSKFKSITAALICSAIFMCAGCANPPPQIAVSPSGELSDEALAALSAIEAEAARRSKAPQQTAEPEPETGIAKIDMSNWQYEEEDGVYWQTGISYCENPADASYETMGIYVPEEYFDAADNGDGTYSCTLNTEAKSENYTAQTAPVVMPINTPGYSAMNPPSGYTNVSDYTDQGFVYLFAGCRGRESGAPAGVTDLKAAIRYFRYNSDILPGSADNIFTFGMSGGGAQSAIIGVSGNNDLYVPYLEEIGAADESDAVAGSMCWCPIINLDVADAAYEWNMGSARSDLEDDEQALSDGLANAYAEYINELALTDEGGNTLVLEKSSNGIYQAGTYYEYIMGVVEQSLNNFLADTTFPYNASSQSGGSPGGMGSPPDMNADDTPNGNPPDAASGKMPNGTPPDMNAGDNSAEDASENGNRRIEDIDNISRNNNQSGLSLNETYETAQDYIDALNADGTWVAYDAATNTATITSLADFVKAMKVPSKSVGAFDDLERSQGENELFGTDGASSHFDAIEAELLSGTEYADGYAEDLAAANSLGNSVETRVNMYNPMYYLCDYYDGAGTSDVAEYFRIRTGISQGDTALCTEVNFALALEVYGCDVDFETVWGEGHTQAERTGNSTDNFIEWVKGCVG